MGWPAHLLIGGGGGVTFKALTRKLQHGGCGVLRI